MDDLYDATWCGYCENKVPGWKIGNSHSLGKACDDCYLSHRTNVHLKKLVKDLLFTLTIVSVIAIMLLIILLEIRNRESRDMLEKNIKKEFGELNERTNEWVQPNI